MAIQKEIWSEFIQENLYTDNEFLNLCFNADGNVVGKTVTIPSAGTAATVERNRSVLPATAAQRTDNPGTYDIDEFTIDPVVVTNKEEVESSYEKMASVMFDIMQKLPVTVGDWMLYNWRATDTGYIARTTGGAVAAHVSSGTGNRKKLLAADIQAAALIMNAAKVPNADRYCILDPYMYDQLLQDLRFGEFRDTIKEADLARGVVGQLFGFKILMRHTVLDYTNASPPVPRLPAAGTLTSANAAALCWQRGMVERAFGDIEVFENENDALYYGSIVSGLVRSGGRKRRYDNIGVVAIVQAAAS